MTSAESDSTSLTGTTGFNIFDTIAPCNPPQCHGSANGPSFNTQVDVSSGATSNDQILLAYGFTSIDCAGYAEVAADSVTIDYTGVGTKTVTDTVSAATVGSRPASSIEVCFGSPTSFPVKPGTTQTTICSDGSAPVGGTCPTGTTLLFVGLLPKCNNTLTNPPCVIGNPKKNSDGSVTVKYLLASGDPVGRH
jgi:hypothetical protein